MFKDMYLGIRRKKKRHEGKGCSCPTKVQYILLKGTCWKQPVSWRSGLKSELSRVVVERMGLPPQCLASPGTARLLSRAEPCSAALPCWQQTKQQMYTTWPLQEKSSDAFLTGSATESFICAHTKHTGDFVRLKFFLSDKDSPLVPTQFCLHCSKNNSHSHSKSQMFLSALYLAEMDLSHKSTEK